MQGYPRGQLSLYYHDRNLGYPAPDYPSFPWILTCSKHRGSSIALPWFEEAIMFMLEVALFSYPGGGGPPGRGATGGTPRLYFTWRK